MESSKKNECLIKKVELQEKESEKFGFYWENFGQLMDQVLSECKEVSEAHILGNREFLEEEVGDLIQAAISLAVYCKLDPREALRKSIEKFQKRYDAVVLMAKEEGHDHLHDHSFDEMMRYWNTAKEQLKPKMERLS